MDGLDHGALLSAATFSPSAPDQARGGRKKKKTAQIDVLINFQNQSFRASWERHATLNGPAQAELDMRNNSRKKRYFESFKGEGSFKLSPDDVETPGTVHTKGRHNERPPHQKLQS